MNKIFWILFPSLVLLAACGRKPAASQESGPPPTVSNFIMKNMASEFPAEIHTTNFAGKVQLVLFFRSDDPACRGSIAELNSLQKDFADRGFTLVGAIVDDRHADQISDEAAALDATWPIGLADSRIVDAFGGSAAIRAIPSAFLIGRDGLVTRTYAGFEPIQNLRDDINCLLEGQPLPPRTPQKP